MMMAMMSVTMAKTMVRLIMTLQWRQLRDCNNSLVGSFSARFYHNDGQNDDLDKCGEEDHDHDHDDHCITMVSTGDLSDSLPESSRILEIQG